MSLLGDMKVRHENHEQELVWKALADSNRRAILDLLAEAPQQTGTIVDAFPELCRTNVMKHLDVLVSAGLVLIRREGRVRWNYINPVPIESICDQWVRRHVRRMAHSMLRLREVAEQLETQESAN